MKTSSGRILFCTRPCSACRNHQKDARGFTERFGNPFAALCLYHLFGGDFSLARRGRSGREGSLLCSHVDVCCLRGWLHSVLRGGGHTDACPLVCLHACCRVGGGAPTFFPVNAVKWWGCSSEGSAKSQGRIRLVVRREPCVPERRPVRMPGLVWTRPVVPCGFGFPF